ncbi:MAG: hypothetical protein HC942_28405 [Microcoleus sp. SU_5_6]|nr:hypothetical protein [Microcoleus sp. SU_5_6]
MRITRKRPLRNGRQRQTAGADRDRTLNNNRMRANNPATLNNDRNAGQGFSEPALAPEWAELNDGLTMNATERLKKIEVKQQLMHRTCLITRSWVYWGHFMLLV